jgi:hypothetical protein
MFEFSQLNLHLFVDSHVIESIAMIGTFKAPTVCGRSERRDHGFTFRSGRLVYTRLLLLSGAYALQLSRTPGRSDKVGSV